jgi:hypothetical protein
MVLSNQQQLILLIVLIVLLGYFVMKDYKRENINSVDTSNNSYSYIYVNGVNQVSSVTGQIDNQPASREVRLGNFKGYPAQYTGRIATCRVYSRALTQAEIRENYYAQKARFGL